MRIDFPLSRAATRWLVVACALVSLAAHAGNEIHRCVDAGRVTYTDRGCGESGEVVAVVAMASVSSTGFPQAAAYDRAPPVALGMSPRMVYEAMGRPLETIATLEGRSLVEYWVYRGVESTTRVAFQEGRVTRIHTR